MRIESDFIDYYDNLSDESSDICYRRFQNEGFDKGKALRYLANMNIPVIKLDAVRNFGSNVGSLVIYIDPKLHNGQGKRLISRNEALTYYGNYLASEFIKETNGVYVKVLQLGTRRFQIILQHHFLGDLEPGKVLSITELPKQLSSVPYPVFSIDYIGFENKSLAVDFNCCENLAGLGIDKIVPADEAFKEIKNTLKIIKGLGA